MSIATPSSRRTCNDYSLPISRSAAETDSATLANCHEIGREARPEAGTARQAVGAGAPITAGASAAHRDHALLLSRLTCYEACWLTRDDCMPLRICVNRCVVAEAVAEFARLLHNLALLRRA